MHSRSVVLTRKTIFSVQGALAGLFSSLGLTLWIGIGSIVEQIPTEQMPKNVSGCDNPIYYSTASLYTEHTTMQLTTEPTYP